MGKRASDYRPKYEAARRRVEGFIEPGDGEKTMNGWLRKLTATSFAGLSLQHLNPRTQLPKRKHDEHDIVAFVLEGAVYVVVFDEDEDESVPAKASMGQSVTFEAGKSFVVSTTHSEALVLWVYPEDFWEDADELEPGVQTIEYEDDLEVKVSPPLMAEAPEPVPPPEGGDVVDIIPPPAMREFRGHYGKAAPSPSRASRGKGDTLSQEIQDRRDARRATQTFKGGEAPPGPATPPTQGAGGVPVNPMPAVLKE